MLFLGCTPGFVSDGAVEGSCTALGPNGTFPEYAGQKIRCVPAAELCGEAEAPAPPNRVVAGCAANGKAGVATCEWGCELGYST